MACVHRLGDIDIGQQHAVLANSYTHLTWPVHCGKRRQPTTGGIGQARWLWTTYISHGLCILLGRHRAWPARIALDLHTTIS